MGSQDHRQGTAFPFQAAKRSQRSSPCAAPKVKEWSHNDDAGAARWVLVNVAISAVFLLAVNLLETRQRQTRKEVR